MSIQFKMYLSDFDFEVCFSFAVFILYNDNFDHTRNNLEQQVDCVRSLQQSAPKFFLPCYDNIQCYWSRYCKNKYTIAVIKYTNISLIQPMLKIELALRV